MDYDFNNVARITPYSIEYSLDCDENGETERFLHFFDTANQMFYFTSKLYAFDDFYEVRVHVILMDGRECKYIGWQPGMVYEYCDCETGEIVFSADYPEWNH